MAGKQSESETDPDDPASPPAPTEASEDELLAYSKSLGADLREPDMAWLVREAFDSALPSSWTEHVDAEGRVYFHNQVTNESTWLHPMDEVYKQLISTILSVRSTTPSADFERRSRLVRTHLLEVHERALAQLARWSGPYKSEAGQYYYNESMQLSTWFSPIEEWEYELAIRHSVLHRCLLAGHAPNSEEAPQDGLSGDDILEVPLLKLPTGLARREEDQNSARSFYTARESSRSGCSARSLGGSEASPPARARKMSPTQPVSPVQEERQGTSCIAEAKGKASLDNAFSEAASIKAGSAVLVAAPDSQSLKENLEEMDITFGCSSSVQMPTLPKKSSAAGAASQEGSSTVAEVKDDGKAVEIKKEEPSSAPEDVPTKKKELTSAPKDASVNESSPPKHIVQDEEFDITFGCSSPVKMPAVPTKPGAAEPPSDETGGAA